MPIGPPVPRSRPRIAFLSDDVVQPYQVRLTSAARRTALGLGADFACFVGGHFNDRSKVSNRFDTSFIYELARAPAVDGIVIATGVLANHVGLEFVRDFCDRCGVPVVSIGSLPGFPHVISDNTSGLQAVVEHLIVEHGLERLAFIRGCAGNPDALERESAIRAVLLAHGLPVREELFIPGAFVQVSGAFGVRELLDKRGIAPREIDAIVAANDQMAVGAIAELSARGICVPDDIAVTGFDDDDSAIFTQPPLTTVRQPLETLAEKAVQLLLDRIAGRATPDCVRVATVPVLRNSCGCSRREIAAVSPKSGATVGACASLEKLRHDCREVAVPLFGVGPRESDRGTEALIDALAQAVSGASVDLGPFRRAVLKTAEDGDDPLRWQDVLQMVEADLGRYQSSDPDLWERGRWFLLQANLAVTETAARAHAAENMSAAQHTAALEVLNFALMSAESERALTPILAAALPALGIRFCCVCLFEESLPERSRARVIAAYDSSHLPKDEPLPGIGAWWSLSGEITGPPVVGLVTLSPTPIVIPTEELLPAGLRTDDAPTFLSVLPLTFARKPLGYAVFDKPWRHGQAWAPASIVSDLSNAVYAIQQAESLQQARRKAEAASLAKGEFVARMSHEIRTPLTAVMGYLDLCLKRISSPNERRYLTQAHASSKVLLGVLNNVLDFSKIEAQRLEVERTPFDLEQVLDQVIATCAPSAFAKNIEMVVDVAGDVPRQLEGDALRLTQVLVNLVGNAIKFTARGEVVLAIDEVSGPNDAISLRFCVRDSGIGITKENLSKLMVPFVQADNSTTRRYGGTGLGLAISQRLVHRMGGTLALNSELGSGTECSFSLQLSGAGEPRFRDDFGKWSDLQALVVDDNAASLNLVAWMLAQTGFRVITAADPDTAIERMEQAHRSPDPFHLLVIDQGLPGRTGSDVVRRLAELGVVGRCRILVMAPLGDLESSSAILAPEVMSGVVSKPVRWSALGAQIRGLFGRSEGEPTTRPAFSSVPDQRNVLVGRRVLVVQDDETNRTLTKEVLESAGLDVQTVESGVEAVERVTEYRFDAILMDLNLPLMDGYEATRLIRQKHKCGDVPIIAVTASCSQDDRQHCFDVGMNDWVQTPVDSTDLLAILAKWVLARGADSKAAPGGAGRLTLSPTAVQKDSSALLAEFGGPWLDVEGALKRLRGDAVLYRRLLRRFLQNHGAAAQQFQNRVTVDDRLRYVHTLASAAANVGAQELSRTARGLELQLRAGYAGSEEDWTGLLTDLRKTLELMSAAAGNSTSPPPRAIDRDRLREDLTRLVGLLDGFDATATDCVDRLPSVVGSGAINDELRRIQRAVRAYDFEEAGQRARALLTTL